MSQSSYRNNIEVLEFEENVMSDKWEDVIDLYKKNKFYHTLKVKERGTALHVAVSNGKGWVVKELVREILSMWNDDDDDDETYPLRMMNEKDATPLHIAAYRGFTSICECIIGKNGKRKDLIKVKNSNGETPFFWAVLGHRINIFVYLNQFFSEDVDIFMDKNGTTILHVAIRREMFSFAYIIMYCYANASISSMRNKDGVTPLQELASRTSAFKSGNHLSPWLKQILYFCYPVKLKDAKAKLESRQKKVKEELDAAKMGDDVTIDVSKVGELEKQDRVPSPSDKKFVSRWPLSLLHLEEIKIIKKRHVYGDQLLEDLMKHLYDSYWGGGCEDAAAINMEHEKEIENIKRAVAFKKEREIEIEDIKGTLKKGDLQNTTEETVQELISKLVPITSDKKGLLLLLEAMKNIETKLFAENVATEETIYLTAAKHGIVEITGKIESKMKSVIHDKNSNNENVLLVAVKYRQPQVVQLLQNRFVFGLEKNIFESLCQHVDNKGNTMLHLAAYTPLQKETTWRTISGPAMQMMCDIKWYKYIQGIAPPTFKYRLNIDKKTPSQIFKAEHEELLRSSTEWLKQTAESASLVAALVAGLSFATSSSVPGGNNDSGKPILERQPAFEGFAISSLIGLYSSGTALIMFLSILISRNQIEDFKFNLPVKLFVGLTSLFVSIVAMFISFCAGHFFVLIDKYGKHDFLFYLLILFSFPVIFYGAMQISLYTDLLKVIWKKLPPPSIKDVHL